MTSEERPEPSGPPPTAQYKDRTTAAPDSEVDFEVNDPQEDCFGRLGRYRVEHELARGGMGVIFKAYDELLHRDVAIKLLQHQFRHKPGLCQRFVNEALLTSRLQHPCIVPIYDCGQASDQRPFFAMKLVAGQSLGQILAVPPQNQLDRSRLLKIFEQVCLTLAYAHSQGVLHLDLKPSNIMVGQFGEVHVMDWGLSRTWPAEAASVEQARADPSGATLANIFGTAAYMAPEQARGEVLCPRTDVFGLGALLCEILTGRPPYRGGSPRRIYVRALQGKLDEAASRLDACNSDARLIALAKQCLSPDRESRPECPSKIAQVVSNYLESALEQAESDLCRFFELTLDLFCIATLDGFFQRVNSNFSHVLGYQGQTLVSQPYLEFVHPEDIEQTRRVMEDLTHGKPVVRFSNRYRRADGSYVRLEWTARSIPEEGHIFAVARDISISDQPLPLDGQR